MVHFKEAFTFLFLDQMTINKCQPSFALMKLFTKIVSHELRNLNSNWFYDESSDHQRLKLELMSLITRLVARNILPSIQSRSKQETANKADIGKDK